MKIFRLVLLALATALFAINFWTIDYGNLWTRENMWAYLRIGAALLLVILLVRMLMRQNIARKRRG